MNLLMAPVSQIISRDPDFLMLSGTVNSKSFVGKVIKWKFELTYVNSNFHQNFELEISLN